MPAVLRHPVQAHLAAPFFVVVELFKLAGLRERLFDDVRSRVEATRREESASGS